MIRLLQPLDLATLPADRPVESRMRGDKPGWAYGLNLSPYIFEIQDETAQPVTVVGPFAPFCHPLYKRTEKLIFHAVTTVSGSTPVPASQWAVYFELSEFEPRMENAAWGAPMGSSSAAPAIVRVEDGGSGTLLTVTAFNADTQNLGFNNAVVSAIEAYLHNGTNWDRARSASAANLGAQSGLGAALVAPPGSWTVVSTPAAGTQASASRAAGGAGVRHIYRSALITWGAIAAPVATLLQGNVRDGATGAGTVIDGAQLAVPAAVFQGQPVPLGDKVVPGTAATAMTAETSAALANLAAGASLQGFDAA